MTVNIMDLQLAIDKHTVYNHRNTLPKLVPVMVCLKQLLLVPTEPKVTSPGVSFEQTEYQTAIYPTKMPWRKDKVQ